MLKVVVIIPCYNEEKYIGDVIQRAKKYVDEVIIVDNGSDDNTVREALKQGAKVVYSHKKGMGAAIKRGLRNLEADIYITMDGDGQHNPDEIPEFINTILNTKVDLVVGIREDNHTMPLYRKVVNNLFSKIYNFSMKTNLQDVQCGFRAFNQSVKVIPIVSDGFGCVIELLIKARKLKLKIEPVNVCCIYHDSLKMNSTLNPIKHGMIALFGIIRWRIWEITGL